MKNIKSNKASAISLNGFIGEFKTPGSNYTIKFFSTLANNFDSGYSSFLKKLEPLRDKIKPASIKDLGSLLQRDINDVRIANDLVPYILNDKNNPSHIAFFPSVLCVLMPKNFLSDDNIVNVDSNSGENLAKKVIYPKPTDYFNDDGNLVMNYSNGWEVLEYYEDNTRTRLGTIKIFDDNSDFLVLDGQHRTNAFRAASGEFPRANTIYQTFYTGLDTADPNKSLKADLSVTLIWFETTDDKKSEIKPDLISRKLFIDVNNSAKSINKSRLILLNDASPNNLITRFFYTYLSSKYEFSLNHLSLFHFGFDFPEDLGKKRLELCPLNLFNPEIIDAGIDWLLFLGKDKYKLGKVSANRDDNNDFTTCERYINSNPKDFFEIPENIYGEKEKKVIVGIDIKSIEDKTEQVHELIYDLLNNFPLVKLHVESTKKMQELFQKGQKPFDTAAAVECFEKAYLGGEGLYYSIQKLNNKSAYYLAINQDKEGDLGIDYSFFDVRFMRPEFKDIKNIKLVNTAYNRLSTLVFAPGYFVAYNFFAKEISLSPNDAKLEFLNRIKSIKPYIWVVFFNQYMDEMFANDLTPKSWPILTNMLLRQIQKKGEFFDSDNHRLNSPELLLIKKKFDARCEDYRKNNLGKLWNATKYEDFTNRRISSFIKDSITDVEELFSKLGLDIDSQSDYTQICKDRLLERCKK